MYEIKDILKIAKICDLVYNKPSELRNLENTIYIDTLDTECLIQNNANEIIVAFNGTEKEILDILPHIVRCGKKINGLGIIHKGYWAKLRVIRDNIMSVLSSMDFCPASTIGKNKKSKKRLYITGHSLGGAMAQLFVLYPEIREKYDVQCVTFGSCHPIKHLDIMREDLPIIQNFYVEEDSLLCNLKGYHNVGDIYVIPKDGLIRMVDNNYAHCGVKSNNLFGNVFKVFTHEMHSIRYYIKEIEKKL